MARRRRMPNQGLAAFTLLFLTLAGVAAVLVFNETREAFYGRGPLAEDAFVSIAPDTRPAEIAEILSDANVFQEGAGFGLFSGKQLFLMGAQYTGRDRKMRFGDYRIAAGASMEEVLALLTKGGNVRYNVTIAEGLTSWDVVQRLNSNELLSGEVTEIPPEGSILPETYDVRPNEDRNAVIVRMQAAMQAALDEAWAARAPDNPLQTKEQLLILASIVEKETRPQEHAKVASVFVNRLEKGMRLQTDPTVIYGITLGQGSLGRGLRRSELLRETPYNTYQIDGLPPTPIANPGRESLMATAQPDKTPYLFFVADGTGGHAFAETLEEHNRNVQVWRRIERERNAAEGN